MQSRNSWETHLLCSGHSQPSANQLDCKEEWREESRLYGFSGCFRQESPAIEEETSAESPSALSIQVETRKKTFLQEACSPCRLQAVSTETDFLGFFGLFVFVFLTP